MDQFQSFEAIIFPADGRAPHLVQLMTSPASYADPHSIQSSIPITSARIPHPEMHMEYIAENLGIRAWGYQPVEALDGMNKKFTNPYVIFYPMVSRDGIPFPVNKTLRDIQGSLFHSERAWLGSIVVAKYRDARFTQMMNASMADFPLIKNYLMFHGSPASIGRVSAPSSPTATGSAAPSAPGTQSTPPSSSSSSTPYPLLHFTQGSSTSSPPT